METLSIVIAVAAILLILALVASMARTHHYMQRAEEGDVIAAELRDMYEAQRLRVVELEHAETAHREKYMNIINTKNKLLKDTTNQWNAKYNKRVAELNQEIVNLQKKLVSVKPSSKVKQLQKNRQKKKATVK